MLRVAITGNVGSGKTYIAQLFSMLGIPVFQADIYAKQAFQQDDIRQLISQSFDEPVFLPNGNINKAVLTPLLISNTTIAEQINKQIHHFTLNSFDSWCAHLEEQDEVPYCIKEAALIFESTITQKLDYIIGVNAPTVVRKKRFLMRAYTNTEKFETIERNQIPSEIKMKLVDQVINNYDNKPLLPQVIDVHHLIISKCS